MPAASAASATSAALTGSIVLVVINAVVSGLCFAAGLLVLWRQFVSPAARAQPGACRVRPINVAWPYFAGMALFVLFSAGFFAPALFGQVYHLVSPDTPLDAVLPNMLGTAVMHLAFIGGALYARRFFTAIQTATGALRPPPAPPVPVSRAVPIGIGVFCVVFLAITLITLVLRPLLSSLGIPIENQDLVKIIADEKSPLRLAVMSFIAIVIAPVSEEIIFRAGLFGYLRTRLPRLPALAIPALLFAFVHWPPKAAVAPLLFALGIILSVAYERTGRLAVPIIAHALLNARTIAAILLGLAD